MKHNSGDEIIPLKTSNLFHSIIRMLHFRSQNLNCCSLKPRCRGAKSIHAMQTELLRSCVEKMLAQKPAASVDAQSS